MTAHPHHAPQRPARVLLGVLFALALTLASAAAAAQSRASLTTADSILFESDRQALQDAFGRSIFRLVADVRPPAPYQQEPMRYDGAAVAVDVEGLAFITTASWLVDAERIALLDGDRELPLRVERIDVRFDLALLRLDGAATGDDNAAYSPLSVAEGTAVTSYTLLSPQTPYELLAQAVVLSQDSDEGGLYWTTTLAAANGYPLVTADGALVALQARRSRSSPKDRGIAIGWPVIRDFLDPPEGLAHAREPDHVVEMRGASGVQTASPTTSRGDRLQW